MIRSALLLFALLAFNAPAFAQCVYPNGDTSKWGWDARASQSCPPGGQNNNSGGGSNNTQQQATDGPIVGMRIHWNANPGHEGVDRYQVDYRVNNGGWNTFPLVWNGTEITVSISNYGITEGNTVCARVRAGNFQQWSSFSSEICADIPVYNPTSDTGVSTVSGVEIRLNTQ